jgi:hypothetical protein
MFKAWMYALNLVDLSLNVFEHLVMVHFEKLTFMRDTSGILEITYD